jgi:D-glycerate 3-kinase
MRGLFKKAQNEVKLATGGVVINDRIFKNFYLPLIKYYINDRKRKKIKTYIIGLQGFPGTGKTVLTALVKTYLKSLGYKTIGFSIDDFYRTCVERQKLFKKLKRNPFYRVRGLPGTHKFNRLYNTLKKTKAGIGFKLPHFDKSLCQGEGDVASYATLIKERQDFIILEGWCVNMPYVEPKKFPLILLNNEYANKIFNELDPKHQYYKTVLNYIKKYQKIWRLLDNKTVMLGKNIRWIESWRIEQEKRMMARRKTGMSINKIKKFIRPYIPFSYLFYDKLLKNKRDINCLLVIGKNHLPEKIDFLK